jgi:hypothetical protein
MRININYIHNTESNVLSDTTFSIIRSNLCWLEFSVAPYPFTGLALGRIVDDTLSISSPVGEIDLILKVSHLSI